MHHTNNLKSFETTDPLRAYCSTHSSKLHPILEELKEQTLTNKQLAGLMLGDPDVMILNQSLMRSIQAKRVLDVGTFTGMSALSAALAIPDDGQVITMDIDHSAYNNHGGPLAEKANVKHKIVVKTQSALETLDRLISDGEEGHFDFAFIDADKENYSNYFDRCVKLLRSGGIIVIDNALWNGRVLSDNKDVWTTAIDACNNRVRDDQRVTNIMLTVGDGLHVAFKK